MVSGRDSDLSELIIIAVVRLDNIAYSSDPSLVDKRVVRSVPLKLLHMDCRNETSDSTFSSSRISQCNFLFGLFEKESEDVFGRTT